MRGHMSKLQQFIPLTKPGCLLNNLINEMSFFIYEYCILLKTKNIYYKCTFLLKKQQILKDINYDEVGCILITF